MTAPTTPVAVTKTILVEAPIEHAFAVFTDGFDRWWPRSHHIGEAELAEAVIEPREGGRWYEKGTDGSECDWGRVLLWDPPHRLVLAWQLTADYAYDPDFQTEVEVRFAAEGDRRTVVSLEHRDLERYGDKVDDVRSTFDSEGGWNGILAGYAEAAALEA
jgi:uncharacterized protein YndB with AHSA1/START domain